MFYRPGLDPHGLAHNPFKALVAPRPIGWISTLDADGRPNLAPYSFFNAIAEAPPMVAYGNTGEKLGSLGRKDTLANIRATGAFVVNIVPLALKDAMNTSSAPLPPGERRVRPRRPDPRSVAPGRPAPRRRPPGRRRRQPVRLPEERAQDHALRVHAERRGHRQYRPDLVVISFDTKGLAGRFAG